jgi:hypothetical protein
MMPGGGMGGASPYSPYDGMGGLRPGAGSLLPPGAAMGSFAASYGALPGPAPGQSFSLSASGPPGSFSAGPLTAPAPGKPATFSAEQERAFREFESYEFESDEVYLGGLAEIVDRYNLRRLNKRRREFEVMKVKAHYFSKYFYPIDLNTYFMWRVTRQQNTVRSEVINQAFGCVYRCV